MEKMKAMLANLGRSWNRLPKDAPVMTISKGSGSHTRFTVDGQVLYLHSVPYRKNLPVKQSVQLDELTYSEVAGILSGMGYAVTLSPEAGRAPLAGRMAHTLQRVTDAPVGSTLTTFTSASWERLYPIARILELAEFDMDVAVQQLFATAARGKWLDYWASFFGVRRITGELDEALRKRMFTVLANIKTNNIAIEELVRYIVQDTITVTDHSPALMEIVTRPMYIDKARQLHDTVRAVKAGGIDYFLNFTEVTEEGYGDHYLDAYDVAFEASGVRRAEGIKSLAEPRYLMATEGNEDTAFALDESILGGESPLILVERRGENAGVELGGAAFREIYLLPNSNNISTAFELGTSELDGDNTFLEAFDAGDRIGSVGIQLTETAARAFEDQTSGIGARLEDQYAGATAPGGALRLAGFGEQFAVNEVDFGSTFTLDDGELGGYPLLPEEFTGRRVAVSSMQMTTADGIIVRESSWF